MVSWRRFLRQLEGSWSNMKRNYVSPTSEETRQIIIRNFPRTSLGSSTWRAIHWTKNYKGHKVALHHDVTDYLVRNLNIDWFHDLAKEKKDFNHILKNVASHAKKMILTIDLRNRQA